MRLLLWGWQQNWCQVSLLQCRFMRGLLLEPPDLFKRHIVHLALVEKKTNSAVSVTLVNQQHCVATSPGRSTEDMLR